jgi:hypothetical protein
MIDYFTLTPLSVEGITLENQVLNYMRRLVYESARSVRVSHVELQNFNSKAHTDGFLKHIFSAIPILTSTELLLNVPVCTSSRVIFTRDITTDVSILPVQDYMLFTLEVGESADIKFSSEEKQYKNDLKYSRISRCYFNQSTSGMLVGVLTHVVPVSVVDQIRADLISRIQADLRVINQIIAII